jgi:subfamily B ATP-binding cassette protein MsbA
MAGWERPRAADTGLMTIIQRSIASLWLTQAFGRERDEFGKFRGTVDDTMRVMFRVHWREVVYTMLVATILGLGVAVILGLGGYLVYRDQFVVRAAGDVGMTSRQARAVPDVPRQFYEPLNKITGSGSTFGQAVVQARRVFEVLDQEPAVKDPPNPTPLPKQPRTIELRGRVVRSTLRASRCWRTCRSGSSRGRWSRSSARAASARARSSRCSRGSTT